MESQLTTVQTADDAPRKHKYAGADWLIENGYVEERRISPLGRAVADLLGDVFLGLYHLPSKQLEKVAWHSTNYMFIQIEGELATFDGDELTRLVFLGHDRMVRIAIGGVGPRYMRVAFSLRTIREGSVFERMPPRCASTTERRSCHDEGATMEPARSYRGVYRRRR
jgi:hypothetical protein